MPRRWTRHFLSLAILLCAAALFLAPARAGAAVTSFQAFPPYFSPNGDGVSDRVRLTWLLTDAAADVQLNISTSLGNQLVRRIDLGARPAGADTTTWDGTDSLSTALSDAIYSVQLVETPVSGSPSFGLVAVVIDNTPPFPPTIDGLVDTSQTESTYAIQGTALAADSVRVYRDGLFVGAVPTILNAGVPDYTLANIALHLGANQLAVRSKDLAGNLSVLTTPITVRYVNAPDLGPIRVLGTAFSPNGDGVKDSLTVIGFLDAPTTRLVVSVRAGALPTAGELDVTTPVTHLYDGPAVADSLRFTWDGRDSTGAPMPDGAYLFRLIADTYDASGNPIAMTPKIGAFSIDTKPPATPFLVPPPPTSTFRNHQPMQGASADAESVYVRSNGAVVATTILTANFSFDVSLDLGPNTFTLDAVDAAGNRSATAGPYTIDYVNPIGFHANERFRPDDAFVFNLDKAGSAIDITIYTLRGRRVRTLTSRDVQLHYDIPWDGKDELGAFAGDGPYVAHAVVTFVDGTRAETKGAVVLVK